MSPTIMGLALQGIRHVAPSAGSVVMGHATLMEPAKAFTMLLPPNRDAWHPAGLVCSSPVGAQALCFRTLPASVHIGATAPDISRRCASTLVLYCPVHSIILTVCIWAATPFKAICAGRANHVRLGQWEKVFLGGHSELSCPCISSPPAVCPA